MTGPVRLLGVAFPITVVLLFPLYQIGAVLGPVAPPHGALWWWLALGRAESLTITTSESA